MLIGNQNLFYFVGEDMEISWLAGHIWIRMSLKFY